MKIMDNYANRLKESTFALFVTFLFLIGPLTGTAVQAQDLELAKRVGGSNFDFGSGIAVDASGNSYVSGFFFGSATFGPGENNETILTSAGSFDIFVAKYNSSGDLVWAKRAGGSSTVNEIGFGRVQRQQGEGLQTSVAWPSQEIIDTEYEGLIRPVYAPRNSGCTLSLGESDVGGFNDHGVTQYFGGVVKRCGDLLCVNSDWLVSWRECRLGQIVNHL